MCSSHSSTTDDEIITVETKYPRRFFNKRLDEKDPEKSEESISDEVKSEDFPTVGFFELFR